VFIGEEIVGEFHNILSEVILKEGQFHARLFSGKPLTVILEIGFYGTGEG
jgi:hypothetical protein